MCRAVRDFVSSVTTRWPKWTFQCSFFGTQARSQAAERSTNVLPTTTSQRHAANHLALATLAVNFSLTIAKAVASYLSGSLAIISSLVDSLVDITSGLVIWLTSRAISHPDPYRYPVGRTRLEPAALMIVSVIMAVASAQVVAKSAESMLTGRMNPRVDVPTLIIMIATVAVKFGLFVLCKRQAIEREL